MQIWRASLESFSWCLEVAFHASAALAISGASAILRPADVPKLSKCVRPPRPQAGCQVRVSGQGACPPAPLLLQEVRSSSDAHLTQRAKQFRDCGPCQCHAGCAAAAVYEHVDMIW